MSWTSLHHFLVGAIQQTHQNVINKWLYKVKFFFDGINKNKQTKKQQFIFSGSRVLHIVYSLLSYVLVKAWIYRFTKFSIITVVVQVVFLQKLEDIRLIWLKFIYTKKAKKFDKISHLIWCLQWTWKLCWLPLDVSKKIQFHTTFHWHSIFNWNTRSDFFKCVDGSKITISCYHTFRKLKSIISQRQKHL